MDGPSCEIPGPAGAQGDIIAGEMSAEPGTSAVSKSSSGSDSRCRKSSRIKARMDKLEAEGAQDSQGGSSDKYNLRLSSLVKRVEVEQRKAAPKPPKGKTKPAPLSKYRRRTANARERMRMQDINEGFEKLRSCLPEMEGGVDNKGKKEKMTKYMVLSLALNYIHALRDILGYPPVSKSGSVSAGTSEESDLGSDAASTRASSVSSSPSSDEMCSNPSPVSSTAVDLKDFTVSGTSPVSHLPLKDVTCYTDPMAGPSGFGFRDNVTCSSPSLSDPSLPPSSPPLQLPDDMDIDESSLCGLDVPIPLATIEECISML